MRSRSRDAAGADRRAALVLELFGGLALAMVAVVVGLNVVGAVAQQRARAAWAKVEQRAPGATPSAPVPAASAPRTRAPEGAGPAPDPEKPSEAPTLPAEDGEVAGGGTHLPGLGHREPRAGRRAREGVDPGFAAERGIAMDPEPCPRLRVHPP